MSIVKLIVNGNFVIVFCILPYCVDGGMLLKCYLSVIHKIWVS